MQNTKNDVKKGGNGFISIWSNQEIIFVFGEHNESKVSICLRIKKYFKSKGAVGRKLFSAGLKIRLVCTFGIKNAK